MTSTGAANSRVRPIPGCESRCGGPPHVINTTDVKGWFSFKSQN